MRLLYAAVCLLLLAVAPAMSHAQTGTLIPADFVRSYNFETNNRYAAVIFESHAPSEDIIGISREASGYVMVVSDGENVDFRIEVPVSSLRTGIALRDQHLASEAWLDARQFPTIIFSGTSIERLDDNRYRLYGSFLMHGVNMPLMVEATVEPIPESLAREAGLGEGRWVSIRSSFSVNLSDHAVTVPRVVKDRVSDVWTVHVSLFGKED